MDVLLWGVLPYLTIAVLVLGCVWRYRYDRFGWTTRSSQLYESRLLRIGSPLFHFGILVVIIGHVAGLIIPKAWTELLVSDGAYHAVALTLGSVAGVCTLAGLVILIVRRRTTGPVFMATTRNDKLMYVVLTGALVLGLWTTVLSVAEGDHGHDYRETVSPWFRSIFVLQPDVASMAAAPWQFKLHTLVGLLLFTLWPFTRLVHALTAPIHYLFRPYIVYRSRDEPRGTGARPPRSGWAPVGTRDRDRDSR